MSMQPLKIEGLSQSANLETEQDQDVKQISRFLHKFDSSIKEERKSIAMKKGTLTKREVNDSMSLLKEVIPNKSVKSIIHILYKTIVKRDSEGNKRNKEEIDMIAQTGIDKNNPKRTSFHVYDSNIKALNSVEGEVYYRFDPNSPLVEKKNFDSVEEELRYKEKQMVAESIINRQYGIQGFLEQLTSKNMNTNIDRSKYKTVAYSVATETCRKIEQVLSTQCHRKIKQVGHDELRTIFTMLLNFRQYLTEEQGKTLIAFFKITYNLGEVLLTEQAMVDLYKAIQELLKQKMINKLHYPVYNDRQQTLRPYNFRNAEGSVIFQLQKLWNSRYEEQLIDFYSNDQQFINIREYFKQIHPEHAEVFTVKSLRSMLYKTVRTAIRHLSSQSIKNRGCNVPELVKMNQQRIRFLMRSSGGEALRLRLLEAYKKTDLDRRSLAKIINQINQFVLLKEKEDKDNPPLPFFEEQDYTPKSPKQNLKHQKPNAKTRAEQGRNSGRQGLGGCLPADQNPQQNDLDFELQKLQMYFDE